MKETTRYKMKWWYVLISALYYFPIAPNNAKVILYIYYYGVPFLFFLFNIKWCVHKLKKLFTYKLFLFTLCYCIIFFAAAIAPIIHNTYDFSYFLDGPITGIIKNTSAGMFLLLIYEKKVSEGSNILEFIEYYIFSLILYILFTFTICLLPGLRIWISQNVYFPAELRADYFLWSRYYTRIGWSGFSGFTHTMRCTIAIIFSYIFILNSRNDKKVFWKWHICVVILLMGNMCYGRSGLAISLLCIAFSSVILYLNRCKNVLFYIPAGASLTVAILVLKNVNSRLNTWYNWAFTFISSFITTGKVNDGSFHQMLEMYFLPSIKTLLFGDGRYIDGEGYYMHTDIGIIRPVLYYGVFFTCLGYIACCHLIIIFKRRLSFLSYRDRQGIMFLLFLTLAIFELKGEVFHNIISLLLPMCLMEVKHNSCDFSQEVVGEI